MNKKFGLIGKELPHSLSPKIHTELFKEKGLSYEYNIIELSDENKLTEFFITNKEKLAINDVDAFYGVNVTIPYKLAIMALLDGLSAQAKSIGAVNTVSFAGDVHGNIIATGHNTDYFGFLATIKELQLDLFGKSAVILGAGGASKAVTAVLNELKIGNITYIKRNDYEAFEKEKPFSHILINCTPVGTFPDTQSSPISKNALNTNCVIDLIYNPEQTMLLKHAKEKNILCSNGTLMLLEQAKASQQIWDI